MTFSLRRAIKLEARPIGAASALVLLLVSVCIGLLITSAIAITMLFIQIKDMKMEIGQWERSLLATTARLNQVEKIAKDRSNEKTDTSGGQPLHTPITLAKADMQLIREYIKVAPPEPGASQKIRLGDTISAIASAPVPESLVDQMPKLRGAKFLI